MALGLGGALAIVAAPAIHRALEQANGVPAAQAVASLVRLRSRLMSYGVLAGSVALLYFGMASR